MNRKHRIVILGSGFGGVSAARQFERVLARRGDVDVVLISHENFFLLTPMLPQVAGSAIDTRHAVAPVRRICRRVRFYEAEVQAVNLEERVVSIAHPGGPKRAVPYDHLLIALGGVTGFYGVEGAAENALTMKSLGDAIRLRNRALDMLERAELEPDAVRKRELLSFAVIGGGFAGVETIAELEVFVRRAAALYGSFGPQDISLTLIEAGARVLPELRDKLGEITKRTLEKRGVACKLGAAVRSVDEGGVVLEGGGRIEASTVVWTAGVAPNPIIANLQATTHRGKLVAEPDFSVSGYPGVWALGDCAYVIPPGASRAYPPTAQHAVRMGPHAARNILASIDGRKTQPFLYKMRGQMANLGEHQAVAMLGGLQVSGFPAWWIWRTYYLLQLPTLDKKVRVALDWTLDLVFPRDVVKLGPWGPP